MYAKLRLEQVQFVIFLILCIVFFLEFLRSKSFISTIFIWSAIMCYRKYKKIYKKSGARTTSEIFQSISGTFINLQQTKIEFQNHNVSATNSFYVCQDNPLLTVSNNLNDIINDLNNFKVGEEIKFVIIPMNSYGKRYKKHLEGWEVNITGTTRIIADFNNGNYGEKEYFFTVRKTGIYKIHISFRGIQIQTFELSFRSGCIDPKQCQVKGLSNGCYPISPQTAASVSVLTYDSLGNSRDEGGFSQDFQLQYKDRAKGEWKNLMVETEDNLDGTYNIYFQINEIGAFEVRVKFRDIDIGSPLPLYILPDETIRQIGRFIKKKTATFKVTMANVPKAAVKVRISQSQISFRIYKCLNLIRWKKIETIKMTRSISAIPDEGYGGLSIINPSYMQNVHCTTEETNLIAGTIFAFLHNRDAGAHTGRFDERRKVFYTEILKRHTKLGNLPTVILQVDRNNILESTYRRISKMSGSNTAKFWKSPWRVIFIGERGIDEGGLRRELFTILTREIFDPHINNNNNNNNNNINNIHTNNLNNPNSTSSSSKPWRLFEKICDEVDNIHPVTNVQLSSKILQKYEFAGKLLAKCVYDTVILDPCLVNVHFSCSFYKQLLDLPIHYTDFAIDDPQYYTSKVKFLLENNIDDAYLDLTFTEEELYDDPNVPASPTQNANPLVNSGISNNVIQAGGKISREIELKPNGANIEVTDENKREYLLLLANYRLAHKVQKQIQAFAKGFYSILPRKLVNIFDEKELELLICGLPHLDVEEMKLYTYYENFTPHDKEIVWFWSTVENFTEEEKAKLIQFITGSSQVPVEGFIAFQPRITIARSYSPRGNLPQAHTCFNKIDLPEYESCSDLSKKLLISITEGVEGFGFG